MVFQDAHASVQAEANQQGDFEIGQAFRSIQKAHLIYETNIPRTFSPLPLLPANLFPSFSLFICKTYWSGIAGSKCFKDKRDPIRRLR